jgi:hypothetical protein
VAGRAQWSMNSLRARDGGTECQRADRAARYRVECAEAQRAQQATPCGVRRCMARVAGCLIPALSRGLLSLIQLLGG